MAIHAPPRALLGALALSDAQHRVRGCGRPIRLVGETRWRHVDKATGEVGPVVRRYGSDSEMDGITYVRCGDRRAARCESCSAEYKGDAWHLLTAGMAGGKDTPTSVAAHPATFVTLTGPSFGPVHGLRRGAPCRARRDRPVCPHGRPLYCLHRHKPGDRRLGEPLCAECYDYEGHVLWQWHVPELWRRLRIRLDRELARELGVHDGYLRHVARVSYSKVGELQARGLVHFHVVVRLDGPDGPDTPPPPGIDAERLGELVTTAGRRVVLEVAPAGCRRVALRWGGQLDTRAITATADRDGRTGAAHPEQVAGYCAKYLTKATEEFGLDGHGKVHSSTDARTLGASRHAVAIIATAERIATDAQAAGDEDLCKLANRYATLGYRGHVLTKSRRYSTTFGALRNARREWRRTAGHPADPAAGVTGPARQLEPGDDHADPAGDETALVIERSWRFVGVGLLDSDSAAGAFIAAEQARARAPQPAPMPAAL